MKNEKAESNRKLGDREAMALLMCKRDGARSSHIAGKMRVARSVAESMLHELERRGLVERRGGDDRLGEWVPTRAGIDAILTLKGRQS